MIALDPHLPRLLGAPYRAANGEQLTIRHCSGWAELDACVDLQRQTWGYPDIEVTPRKAFLLAQALGGHVIAAFDRNGCMAGFAMAMAAFAAGPGEENGAGNHAQPQPYLHSHMLAVTPAYRNQGLGTALKLAQREDALDRGILRMTWTFDPLAAKNAYLNLHRLGAVARRYSPDFYGISSSRLQGGLPTDRLHAEWWLQSPRVCARVAALHGPAGAAGDISTSATAELAGADTTSLAKETISLPSELEAWKQSASGLVRAGELQMANRALFLDAFARGLAVTNFSKDASGNGVFELTEWDDSLLGPKRTAYED